MMLVKSIYSFYKPEEPRIKGFSLHLFTNCMVSHKCSHSFFWLGLHEKQHGGLLVKS
jgi:hypothetical protein